MKKIFSLLLLGLFTLGFSQYTLPAESPRATLTQQFSLSSITIDYGKPGVKGRKVFGELVPYGKVWRAGANSSTKITFKEKVLFGGAEVPSGTYGLFAIPEKDQWTLILSKDSQSWGTQYDEAKDFLRVNAGAKQLSSKVEWYNMELIPQSPFQTHLVISWENTEVSVPIEVFDQNKTKQIQEKLTEIRTIERAPSKK